MDKLTQIVETIKTLNLNLNQETTLELAKAIKPIFLLHYGTELLINIGVGAILVGLIYGCYKLITQAIEASTLNNSRPKLLENTRNANEQLDEILSYMPRIKNKRK